MYDIYTCDCGPEKARPISWWEPLFRQFPGPFLKVGIMYFAWARTGSRAQNPLYFVNKLMVFTICSPHLMPHLGRGFMHVWEGLGNRIWHHGMHMYRYMA